MNHIALGLCLHAEGLEPPDRALGRDRLHWTGEAIVDDVGQRNRQQHEGDWKSDQPEPMSSLEKKYQRSQHHQERDPLRENLRAGRTHNQERGGK